VIGNDGKNFSAGANLVMILLNAQEANWKEIDIMIRKFQSSVIGLRRCSVPVVVAPSGLTLGGGCEICLHGDEVQAAAETYMGQVEVGVGLLPAGGGTKELLVRATDSMPIASDPLPYVRHVFELIGFGKVSTSAPNAKRLGLLRDIDGYTMNKERLFADAKDRVLRMVKKGYQPSQPRYDIMVGGDGIRVALNLSVHLAWRAGYISEHDVLIGQKISHVISGGALPHATKVSEDHLLDLEREGFLSLCGEPKTRERISHTLKTGKTLRN
jgi:3-hydroxyacyl-CoA dehydrogenase